MEAVQTGAKTEAGPPPRVKPEPKRYLALDAFRGFIMMMLASEGLGFYELRNDPTWGGIAHWFQHVPWEGAVFWDMIQARRL